MHQSLTRLSVTAFACVCITFLSSTASAQLKTNFSATPVSGCSPLIVNFTDLSTGAPTSWRWDLGNGTISTRQNPTATYFNAGSYSIKLVIRNSNGEDSVTRTQYITVFPKPNAAFTASDTTGCFPHTVQFSDQSTPTSGTLTNWFWDFGDGTTSTLVSPSHTYTSAGNFTVSLRVINSNGCSSVITKQGHVIIASGVNADFSNTSPATCASNPTISFTNTSTGPGTLSYEWLFGDGGTSAIKDPQHTYTTPGSFTVILIASSPQGCRDSIVKENLISYGAIRSEFTYPANNCVGTAITFKNTTTPMPGATTWYFGDGTISTSSEPAKVYTDPGTYIVKLVNDFGACKDSITHEVTIAAKPVANFTADKTTSCQAPFTVAFSSSATASNSYAWDFGDGSTSTQQNPGHTFASPGVYTITLTVTNSNGCTDTLKRIDYIRIAVPEISVSGLPRKGCLPLTINPVATVTANEPVASYKWDFGDGSTSVNASPSHTYTIPGNYSVTLSITTTGGCTQTLTLPNAVIAGLKPQANFTVSPGDVCAIQPVNFMDATTGNADQWYWEFGDGTISSSQNPSHLYSDTGYFNVRLVVWSNTCPDTITINKVVHVRPPIASFIIANSCTQKYTKQFTDRSVGAETWSWDFGDGSTSNAQSPSHTYTNAGSYKVTLTVTNGQCSHFSTQTVVVIDEKAGFVADQSTVCRNTAINFASPAINASNIQQWQWDFGDGSPFSNTPSSVSHTYNKSGTFKVVLFIKDNLGCTDTSSLFIIVYGPTADFQITNPAVCLDNGKVTFTDKTSTDSQHPITSWNWDYGDGSLQSYTAPPFEHTYTTRGNFNVSLTVTDQFGCSDKITKNDALIIAKPVAGFNSPDTASCIDKPVSFINTSSGETLSYQWKFGDGVTSTMLNPVHNYLNTGLYSVELNVKDKYGCTDQLIKADYINISLPIAGFSISDSFSSCPPLKVEFTSKAQNFTSVRWDFGDGNTSTLENPEHNYTLAGIFYAMQFVTGPGGCVDTISKRIEVKGPSGNFSYTPRIGCDPLTTNFSATIKNGTSILWDFTDGSTETTTGTTISHIYTTPGDYIPRIILTDAGGCNVPVQGIDTIHVIGIRVDFAIDKTSHCDNGLVSFTNNTVSNDYISSWKWNFGDGGSSNEQHPQHSYVTPGTYSVSLQVTSAFGCSSVLELVDTIHIYPRPLIAISGDASACVPATAQFIGNITRGDSTLIKWSWNFGNGNSDTLRRPASQLYNVAGNYIITAIATDEHACSDTATHSFVANPLPVTDAGIDQVLCLGTPVQLQATGANTYVWQPATALSCTNCADPKANPTETITYTVTGTNSFGCSSVDSVNVRVRKPFKLVVNAGDTICAGESSRLSASGADLYQWTPSSSLNNSSIADPVARPLSTTLYRVIASDNDRCFYDSATVPIKVYPVPAVDAGIDQVLSVGATTQLKAKASSDVTNYSWTPAYNLSCPTCSETNASPRRTTEYVIQVSNEGGCTSKDALTVSVICNNANLFIPNTFSPNGNGMNEYFYPRGRGIAKIASLRVFNRWGEMVFERLNFDVNNAGAGWDGTFKGKKLTADVFVYTCEVLCENNEIITYKGDVTLLR